jgi:hypothetical protein
MGWHDSFVHAFAFSRESFEFVLDIDYVLQWDKPKDDEYFSFWVAPATLVFWNGSELEIHLEPFDDGRMQVLSSQPVIEGRKGRSRDRRDILRAQYDVT